MALNSFRIRRALSLSSTLLQNSLNRQPKHLSTLAALTNPLSSVAASPANKSTTRPFTSTSALYFSSERKVFDPATDEIGPDTILFEGCDYNHWLITVDFPKDANVSREQMIDTYVNTAAQVFGSVEEAKKKIYALSTTTYQGFQVECSEETSKKFEGLPGVVFILPDSYIDPTNKEYGGDKYVNGEIFPRPPPVHYGRNVRERRRQSYGPPQQQSNRPPPQSQNYGPPQHQQNYGPPPLRQDFGLPQQQQNYGPPPQQQKFEPTQQPQHSYVARPPQHPSYGPPPQQQNYGPPPQQQNYGPPPQQQNYRPLPQQQNYGPPPPQQQNNGPPPRHQNYGPPPPQQQNYSPPPQQQNYGPPPPNNFVSQPPQQQYSPPPPSQHGQGQRDFQRDDFLNNVPSERRGYP